MLVKNCCAHAQCSNPSCGQKSMLLMHQNRPRTALRWLVSKPLFESAYPPDSASSWAGIMKYTGELKSWTEFLSSSLKISGRQKKSQRSWDKNMAHVHLQSDGGKTTIQEGVLSSSSGIASSPRLGSFVGGVLQHDHTEHAHCYLWLPPSWRSYHPLRMTSSMPGDV